MLNSTYWSEHKCCHSKYPTSLMLIVTLCDGELQITTVSVFYQFCRNWIWIHLKRNCFSFIYIKSFLNVSQRQSMYAFLVNILKVLGYSKTRERQTEPYFVLFWIIVTIIVELAKFWRKSFPSAPCPVCWSVSQHSNNTRKWRNWTCDMPHSW